MTRPTPPRTSSLHHAQDRNHVILDLDRLTADEFMRHHGDALRAMLIQPLDVDTYEPALDDYRADIGALENALSEARDTLRRASKAVRQIADDLTDLDSGDQPMFDKSADILITLSEKLDTAVDDADGITRITD